MDPRWGSLSKIAAQSVALEKKVKKGKKRAKRIATPVVLEPVERKRKKREDILAYEDPLVAAKRIAQFPGHGLTEEDGLLWCTLCSKYIAFKFKASVRQHCLGTRSKGGVRTKTKVHKHTENVKLAAEKEAAKALRANSVVVQRQDVWNQSGGTASAIGSTLPAAVIADRIKIIETLWSCGIPLGKLRSPKFLDLIESAHSHTGGYTQIVAQQPVAVTRAKAAVRVHVQDRLVSLMADGSKINFTVEAVLARFVTDAPELKVRQICIGVSAPPTSLTAQTLELAFREHLMESGIVMKNVVGVMTDSGQPNPAVFGSWNTTARQRFYGQRLEDEQLLWIPCLMHAMSNLGTHLRKAFPLVKLFMSGYKKMTNTSETARALWREECQSDCPRLADKSFWKWWDCAQAVLRCWPSLSNFLKMATRKGIAAKSVAKMVEAFAAPALKIQMEFCIAAGLPFHHAGFLLEGDGFALPFVQGRLSIIGEWCSVWKGQQIQHPMIRSATAAASLAGLSGMQIQDLAKSLHNTAKIVVTNFERAVLSEMGSLLNLYRAGGLLHPGRYLWEFEKADFSSTQHLCVDTLVRLKGIVNRDVLKARLLGEHVEYLRAAKEWRVLLGEQPGADTPSGLWEWWRAHSEKLSAWFEVAKILVLLQPSSAAIERFYSLVKANSDDTQGTEVQETLASRSMLLYNE